MLATLVNVARRFEDDNIRDLLMILQANARWHLGEFDISTFDDGATPAKDSPTRTLSDYYRAWYLNSAARFKDSQAVLNGLGYTNTAQQQVFERFIGADLTSIVTAWKFWNRSETLCYEGYTHDMLLVEKVFRGECEPSISRKGRVFLLLAAGVFFLHHQNMSKASLLLQKALHYATGGASVWCPRIWSALSIVDYELGNIQSSRHFLDLSLSKIGSHFGPSGWMLRVVEALRLHGEGDDSHQLLSSIAQKTARAGELGYNLWVQILRMRLQPNAQHDVDKMLLFASKNGMIRASREIIRLYA